MGSSNTEKLFLSVIIPTKNNAITMKNCLESIFQQDFPDFEVIVVDGHSKDGTIEIVKSYPAKVVYEDIGTRGGACNLGANLAKGQIIVFTDGDCVVPRDWFSKIAVKCRDYPSLGVLGGVDLNIETDSVIGKTKGVIEIFRRLKPNNGMKAAFMIKGCNSIYNKEVFLKFGGFDPALRYHEEAELHAKLACKGVEIIYDPSIFVWHHRQRKTLPSLRGSVKIAQDSIPMLFRRHVMKTAVKSPSSAIFTSYLLLVGTLLCLLGLIAASFLGNLWVILELELIFLIVGIIGYSLWAVSASFKFPESALVPIVVLLDMAFRTIGMYLGIFRQIFHRFRSYKRKA